MTFTRHPDIVTTMLEDKDGKRQYVNDIERKRFLCVVQTLDNYEVRAFCGLLFYTGCRFAEALAVCPCHVDLDKNVITFRTLKQKKDSPPKYRHVPVPPHFMTELELVFAIRKRMVHRADEPLWTITYKTAYRRVKEVMAKAEIIGAQASPKGLRHSYAVLAITKGVPLPLIQKWMGHSTLEITGMYMKMVGKEETTYNQGMWTS